MSMTTTAGRSFLVSCTAWRPVWRFADHLDIAFRLQQRPQPLADDRVVLRQQDGDSFHKRLRNLALQDP